jgi:hypothetical protein
LLKTNLQSTIPRTMRMIRIGSALRRVCWLTLQYLLYMRGGIGSARGGRREVGRGIRSAHYYDLRTELGSARAFIRSGCAGILLTTPSAPLRNGTFLLGAAIPPLKRRGMAPSRNQPHSPPFSRRGGCALNKCREASLAPQTGWLSKSREAERSLL